MAEEINGRRSRGREMERHDRPTARHEASPIEERGPKQVEDKDKGD